MEPDLAVDAAGDAAAAVEALAACTRPFLIGVRHHSPLLAAAVPALLDAAAPELLLVELPPELEPWIGWLGAPATVAPIALAVAGRNGNWLGFYPFADFSPELAAIRWAVSRGVPVRAIDLPATATARLDTEAAARGAANDHRCAAAPLRRARPGGAVGPAGGGTILRLRAGADPARGARAGLGHAGRHRPRVRHPTPRPRPRGMDAPPHRVGGCGPRRQYRARSRSASPGRGGGRLPHRRPARRAGACRGRQRGPGPSGRRAGRAGDDRPGPLRLQPARFPLRLPRRHP